MDSGNIDIDDTAGLTNIDGYAGINIGNKYNGIVNIGTTLDKTINIGNQNSTTINIESGNIISLNSASANQNAIDIYSNGGIDINTTKCINLRSACGDEMSIYMDSTFNNGGIIISSGSKGIVLSSNGGYIALGSFSGGDIYIGTANITRSINIGNGAPFTSVNIKSGSGGINIGDDDTSNNINIGNYDFAKTINIGNTNQSTQIFNRFGSSFFSQKNHITLTDSDHSPTTIEIVNSILIMTPTDNRSINIPSATTFINSFPNIKNNDSFDLCIINLSGTNTINLVTNNILGNSIVFPNTSAQFRFSFNDPVFDLDVYRLS